jgi:hypothetical protein
MPMDKSDRSRLIGILYLSALFGQEHVVEMSNNIRRLIVELRTAVKLSGRTEEEQKKDIDVLTKGMELWRNKVLDNLDKDHISATAFCFTILDELSVLVEEKYGEVDFETYTRVMRESPTEG